MDEYEQAKSFFAETTEAFHFLEQQYEYQRLEGFIQYPGIPRERAAISRYVGSRVGVEIGWDMDNATLSVAFLEQLQAGLFPESRSFSPTALRPGVARAISLANLVDLLGPGTRQDPDFLLKDYLDCQSIRELDRAVRENHQMIRENTRGILAGLAHATQAYASAILHGDTTMFSDVMNYGWAKREKM
jgi:hypothetical protein